MEHKITIMKYQTMFPGMTKKLFDEKERFYQIADKRCGTAENWKTNKERH